MPRFQLHEAVVLLQDPGRVGRVVRVDEDDQLGEVVYSVRFDQRQQTCLEDDLAPAAETRDSWTDLLQGASGSASRLSTLLTWERIRRPPGIAGAAVGSARATLYPYQLKPLVRFLESANHRLLIADEVGLGKTVEAGYIVHEWIERTGASRILVLVPARLRSKWREELLRCAPVLVLAIIDETASLSERPIYGGSSLLQGLLHSDLAKRPEAILERLTSWCADPGRYPGLSAWLDRWLMQAVESRVPGWRRAFDLLTEPR